MTIQEEFQEQLNLFAEKDKNNNVLKLQNLGISSWKLKKNMIESKEKTLRIIR